MLALTMTLFVYQNFAFISVSEWRIQEQCSQELDMGYPALLLLCPGDQAWPEVGICPPTVWNIERLQARGAQWTWLDLLRPAF